MPKNDNFKTQDFSPLIERVLAGVSEATWKKLQNATKGKYR